MKSFGFGAIGATWLALALGPFTGPAMAGSPILHTAHAVNTVHITLGDPSSTPPLAAMMLITKPDAVSSGQVTFAVANTSKTMEHELLVVSAPGNHQALPYNETNAKVVEDRIDKVGDSGDLPVNASKTFTLDLKPGKYLLMCNEPGHYKAGMWAWLTVKGRTFHSAAANP